ncbi:RNA polymerase sigma-70 factor, ECF subfamily [Bryocella elongata]|uniref:RNA polymerase sigma-70 factor, ECF subfamily n=1 Tax=Bryocella elongata TaxID=863522 RepID=A0A1H6C6F9_9BACT|nr:RNA polymerase sigma factor [Bryocella elongata]SEG68551.1 RNA polymerase sigma-70 factor, ECF subfamily [Bryocella elongata]
MALPRTQAAGGLAKTEHVDLIALVQSHASTLYRVAYSVVRNAAEAEDVVQDTFVRVLEHRKRLPEVLDLRVWLIRIAWNLALDRRRKLKPADSDELVLAQLVATGQPADDAVDAMRRLRAVLAAMDGLPKLERQTLLLTGVEELSTAEIAGVLERSESAVRALLFRARTRLKERLKKGGYA